MKKLILFIILFFLPIIAYGADVRIEWNDVPGCTYEVHYGNESSNYANTIPETDTRHTLTLDSGVYYLIITAHLIDCPYTACGSHRSGEVSILVSDVTPAIVTISFTP